MLLFSEVFLLLHSFSFDLASHLCFSGDPRFIPGFKLWSDLTLAYFVIYQSDFCVIDRFAFVFSIVLLFGTDKLGGN